MEVEDVVVVGVGEVEVVVGVGAAGRRKGG